ncbi:MAG: ABC transporter ATP-binding protein [Xanthobacteraceae bacterium]|nr:MAG: ABC transporter ATP-binding protein [Xanthobacteraceae bacterium]
MKPGEIVTLLGRNGMGKSTTVKCITGLNTVMGGAIRFRGERIDGREPHRICHLGIGLVPEGRHIFPNLTVRENLMMSAITRAGREAPWNLKRVLEFFPRLGERLTNGGAQLSGGEQQMLAISRALMTNPDLLILDEATEGLSPLIRQQIWQTLGLLKATGLSMLVIDKEIDSLCRLADRHYIVEKGEVVWSGSSDELMSSETVQHTYLSV